MENMKPWDIIKLLENTPGRNDKIEILKSQSKNHEFKRGLIACYDPYITYGIKQIPIKEKEVPLAPAVAHALIRGSRFSTGNEEMYEQVSMAIPRYVSYNDFEVLALKQLRSRRITGNDAKDLCEYVMGNTKTPDEWNYWYRRILLKDLKCGITAKTINKSYGGNLIKTFGVQLASDSKDKEHLMGESIIENKYDGVRCIAIINNNKVTYYTRNGKEINPKIIPNEVHNILNVPELQGLVFDGELMSSSFAELMHFLHKKYEIKMKEDLYYAIFDVIPYDEFVKGESTKTLIERKEQLNELSRTLPDFFWAEQIQCVEYNEVDLRRKNRDGVTTGESSKLLSYYLDEAVRYEFEGIIVKDRNSLWRAGRSNSWLKVKPFVEKTLAIIDIEEGTGKNKGRLGNLVCEGVDTGQLIKTNVGSGFTDEDRQIIWDNRDKYIGYLVEIRGDSVTEMIDGKHSIRFPRFKGWRGLKPGEKI